MDRDFSETELSEIVKLSLQVYDSMLPYLCKENFACRFSIARHFKAVKRHNLVPEQYWHGNKAEFETLLTLLSDDYPSVHELLSLARTETRHEIQNIAHHHYQHVVAMFDFVTRHHGYVVLKPTEYMILLYPNSKGMIYVYTYDVWSHCESSGIDKAFLVFEEGKLQELSTLVRRKIYSS